MNKTTSVILQPEYVELFQCDGNNGMEFYREKGQGPK